MSMTTELVDRLRDGAHSIEDYYEEQNEESKLLKEAADTIELLSAKLHANQMERSSQYYHGGWIPCKERLPEMHEETGILKRFVSRRSEEVLVTIKDRKYDKLIVHSKCELLDGKWHGDIFKWLEASNCDYKVTAWMPLPKPFKEGDAE